MGTAALLVMSAVAAAASAGAQVYAADKQARQSEKALNYQKEEAEKTAEASRQAQKKADSAMADTSEIVRQNQNGELSGGATLLTGPSGVDQSELKLNKQSTLG